MSRARVACGVVSFEPGQQANPSDSSPNPATRATAIPAAGRSALRRARPTNPGAAIRAKPVAISIPADNTTRDLVLIGQSLKAQQHSRQARSSNYLGQCLNIF